MVKVLGFWRSWALVVGTIIGAGIFTLPAILAPYGSTSFIGWGIVSIGAISIALSLSFLASRIPRLGGPYAYVYDAFGYLPAVLVAWGYWITLLVSIAAIATAFSGYAGVFFPILAENSIVSSIVSIIVVWIFTMINIKGIKEASIVQVISVILKIVPLAIIGIGGILIGDIASVPASNPNNEPIPIMISGITMLILWSYIGIEVATIPSDDVDNPTQTIPRALMWGVLATTLIYMTSVAGVMALISPAQLQHSTSPFADAAVVMFGEIGSLIVGFGALISIGGALNSNILIAGKIPMAAAQDYLFPSFLKNKNLDDTPVLALMFSAFLVSLIIIFNIDNGLIKTFQTLILFSSFTILIIYLLTTLASIKMQLLDYLNGQKTSAWMFLISILAAFFSISALALSSRIV